jgi:beta-glucosidase
MRSFTRVLSLILCVLLAVSAAGCGEQKRDVQNQQDAALSPKPSATQPSAAGSSTPEVAETPPDYLNSRNEIEDRVNALLAKMNLDEKLGQMIQAESSFIRPDQVAMHYIGSVLAGGGYSPGDKSTEAWMNKIEEYQRAAASTRLGIPIIYGVDAVHGMAKFSNAVVFPHNSGLGAANDPILMEEIGEYTAKEMLLCNVAWNFAPCVAVAQDIRWGRAYESYSENPTRVSNLSSPYIVGLQSNGIVACAKHFFGDGGTAWGTGDSGYYIDRGNLSASREELQTHLDPYEAAIKSGVRTIMVSFSSINGVKMHENAEWVQKWLKDEMGFTGIVVSDWAGIQLTPNSTYHHQVVKAVNAGIDMLMEPDKWLQALSELKDAVINGEISIERIDDAVSRILRVKFENGLFDDVQKESYDMPAILAEARSLAREAVAKSLVLLKNDNGILPLEKNANLLVLGRAANDMAIQCGGWTIDWQGLSIGRTQKWINGSTIFQGLQEAAARGGGNIYTDIRDADKADAIILVLGEKPHAEGPGDDAAMSLYEGLADPENRKAIDQANAAGLPVITILVSGRPRIITHELNDWNAFVMAWLPGSEGGGVADVLYGYQNFSGTLPFTWPASMGYFDAYGRDDPDNILFEYGHGMTY